MKPGKRDETLFLSDIADAIGRILRYTAPGRDAFFADPMSQDAVLRNMEIIGEAARSIGAQTRERHPEIPWREMGALRNRVLHEYFGVDLEVVWDVVSRDLLPLLAQIRALLGSQEGK